MMECSCIYVDTEGDCADFHSVKFQKARKSHNCSECKRVIESGEKYEAVAGVWEGFFETYKTCEDCLSIRNQFFCTGWLYGEIHNLLFEHIQEMDGKISEDCILELSEKAQQKVFEIIENVWTDQEG